MSVHEALRTLVTRFGERVLEDADDLRATLNDFLDEGQATRGEINLLADAVQLGAYQQMSATLSHGAHPRTAVEAAGERLAKERGADQRSATWACAALGYAVGRVPGEVVLSYRGPQPNRGDVPSGRMHPPPPGATGMGGPPPNQRNVAGDERTRPNPMGAPPAGAAQTPAAPPPHWQGPPSQPAPLPPSRSARPALALVVLVVLLALLAGGGWWLTRDPGGAAGEDASAGTEPSAGPGSSRSTAGPTSEPTEATSDPTTEPTTEPTETTPTEDDPLGVGAPFLNQPCEDQIVVVLASSGEPDKYLSTLAPIVEQVPGAKYLRTDQSCESFAQELAGEPIYAAYIGPFASETEACEERYASGTVGAYVRPLEPGVPGPNVFVCSCRSSADELPSLSISNASDVSYEVRQYVVDLQQLLYDLGYNPDRSYVTGNFRFRTRSFVRGFQRDYGLVVDGVVGRETWDELLTAGCP